jgi:hypothetical protein
MIPDQKIPAPKRNGAPQAEKPVAGDKGTELLCPQRKPGSFCGPSFAEPSKEEIAISAFIALCFIGDKEKYRTRWRLPSRNFPLPS